MFKRIWSAFTAIIMVITLLLSPKALENEKITLVDTDNFVLEKALIMGQGITTDGEYYYTSGSFAAVSMTALAKYTFEDMEYVSCNFMAIPYFLMKEGFDHIGGIGNYNGKIYAALEGEGEEHTACIAVYDTETLEFTGEYYYLPEEKFSKVPWCCVDMETGYLYASVWDDAEYVYVFDVNNEMEYVKDIKISGCTNSLDRIQGCEIYNGNLYLSQDTHDSNYTKFVYRMNIDTGETEVAFERRLTVAESLNLRELQSGTTKRTAH